jgi:hypothetical protein
MKIGLFIDELADLITDLMIQTFDEDSDEDDFFTLTIGANSSSWNYQTGDNSFTGGAYGYRDWGVMDIYPNCSPTEVALDIVDQLEEQNLWIFDLEEDEE